MPIANAVSEESDETNNDDDKIDVTVIVASNVVADSDAEV
jgi:hypothetical protein